MTSLLKLVRRVLNRRRIKRIEARKAVLVLEQARYRAVGLPLPAAALGVLIRDADELIRQLSEAA